MSDLRLLGEALIIQVLLGPLAALGWFALDVGLGIAFVMFARLVSRN